MGLEELREELAAVRAVAERHMNPAKDEWDDDLSLRDVIRRLDRMEIQLELRLDARSVSAEVYQVEKVAAAAAVATIESRVKVIEDAQRQAVKMLLGAFVGLIIEGVVLALKASGKVP